MSVRDAVFNRRSVRAFLPRPVDRVVIERVLDRARYAPSGGNVQPWHAVVVAGEPLQQLFAVVQSARASGGAVPPDYPVYPEPLPEPWKSRRRECAADMYGTLGLTFEDKSGRVRQAERNFIAFDAPCMLFCHTPKLMGPGQWADLGIWLQTVMLLLEEEGVGSCPQAAWATVGEPVRKELGIGEDQLIYCGLAIGYPDEQSPVNSLRTRRAELAETVRFLGL